MRKEILSSLCAVSLLVGATTAFAGSYGDQPQNEESPAPPPAPASVVMTETEVDYARTGAYIGVGETYAIEFFSQGAGNPKNNAGGDADNSNGFHVSAGYRIIPNLAVEALYEHYTEFDTDPGHIDGWSGTVNAKGYILTGQFQPYALVGLGYIDMDGSGPTGNPAAAAAHGDGFVMRFGGGLDVCIGEHWALGPEIAYVLPFGDASNMDMMTVGAGAYYKF